jgi:peptide deformylase
MRKIVKDEAVLRKISEPVGSVKEAQEIIAELTKTLRRTDNGVGLAAIQIGIPKTVGVIIYQDGDVERVVHLINPKLVEAEDEVVFPNEGCLSFPGKYNSTKRYQHYIIDNQVIDGDEFRTERHYYFYSPDPTEVGNMGLRAIAVQHEMDHFAGKLIHDFDIKGTTLQREGQKVGRNDKCPCGSGKKFKKCCLGNGVYD